jgi:predicted nucleotidyltransferase
MPVTFEYNNQNLESGMPTTSYENIPDRVSLTFLASRLKNISMTDVEKDDAAKDFYNKYSKSQDVEELKKVQNIFKEQSINMDLDMLKELAAVINIETTKETEIVKDRMLELISHGASIMPYVALNSEYSQKINDFINSFDEDSSHDSKQTSLEERFE